MVMIEGMACGLPVVSFDCKCGPKDIIRQGENGLLVADGDIAGLADALMEVMGDDDRRKRMSRHARKITDTYAEEAVMGRWSRLFASITRA